MPVDNITSIVAEKVPQTDFSSLESAIGSIVTLCLFALGLYLKKSFYDPKKETPKDEETKSLYSQYKYETNELIRVEISNLSQTMTDKIIMANALIADKFIKALKALQEDEEKLNTSFTNVYKYVGEYKLEVKKELKEMRDDFVHKDNCASKMLSKKDKGT